MTPEEAARVFDPYFSTKDLSRGPGLGLTMNLRRVNEHGGWMEVDSQPGKGSSFTMFLPRAAEPAIRPKPVAVADPKATEGKECVMIVDDENWCGSSPKRSWPTSATKCWKQRTARMQ